MAQNHQKWQDLTPRERIVLIGSLVHAVQNSPESFEEAARLINKAKKRGTLDGVEILPDALKTEFVNQN
jgi:hypothetical protein